MSSLDLSDVPTESLMKEVTERVATENMAGEKLMAAWVAGAIDRFGILGASQALKDSSEIVENDTPALLLRAAMGRQDG